MPCVIAGLVSCSLVDFPGRVAAVLFTQGCDLKCRYCHNPQLCQRSSESPVSQEFVLNFLLSRAHFLTGVVLSGGEPTLHERLPSLLEQICKIGFAVKIDTNGMRPRVMEKLGKKGLLNYAAVDVKVGPGVSSFSLCGAERQADLALETLDLLVQQKIPCEARTTLVKGVHDRDSLFSLARALTSVGVTRWRLQPVRRAEVLDPTFPLDPPEREGFLREVVEFARSVGIEGLLEDGSPSKSTDALR